MKSAYFIMFNKKYGKRIHNVGEKLYKFTSKNENKYGKTLTMVVAGVYISKTFFTLFSGSL